MRNRKFVKISVVWRGRQVTSLFPAYPLRPTQQILRLWKQDPSEAAIWGAEEEGKGHCKPGF